MKSIPVDLCFPKPPFRIEASWSCSPPTAVLTDYLKAIRSWRARVLESLSDVNGDLRRNNQDLTDRAIKALVCFLSAEWSEGMKEYAMQGPYNINCFPAAGLKDTDHGRLEVVMEVLRWRAGLIDYLSDIWDVFGEPDLEVGECAVLEGFLHPAYDTRLCYFCLNEFLSDELPAQD